MIYILKITEVIKIYLIDLFELKKKRFYMGFNIDAKKDMDPRCHRHRVRYQWWLGCLEIM